jgi:phosphatidylglycerol lysyltransferase
MTTLLPPPDPGAASLQVAVAAGPLAFAPPSTRNREQVRAHARLAARFGTTGVAPFLAAGDVEVIDVLDGWAAGGYLRSGRWAVTAGDVVAPDALADTALDQYLHQLRRRRLRPAFVAVSDPEPFRRRGFAVCEIADEAVLDLADFTLAGSPRAGIRHAVASARRAGLQVRPFEPADAPALAEISQQWLRTKRGGELGFTLSRHGDVLEQLADGATDLWCVAAPDATIWAWCTWRHYRDGRARVIDVMRRRPDAPNPAMDYLLATTLAHYRDNGVQLASLASVPRPHGELGERIYPTRSLRSYKQKFAPRWEPRWLAIPHRAQEPFAQLAIARAYCPLGLRRALRRNH